MNSDVRQQAANTGSGPTRPSTSLPRIAAHDEVPRWQRIFWGVIIVAAVGTAAGCVFRIATEFDVWQWWVPVAFVAGIAAADFGSGLVHWAADTWGRDDFPVIGSRLLVPFRVHHINPDDFLSRHFLDTNGDVAAAALPVLVYLFFVPLGSDWGEALVVFGTGLCAVGMFTNQIHQWAHMPCPPRAVSFLQATGILLGRVDHRAHHARPYNGHYCITTGWCNRPLERLGLFRALETLITRISGAQPRQDDDRYEQRYGTGRLIGNG